MEEADDVILAEDPNVDMFDLEDEFLDIEDHTSRNKSPKEVIHTIICTPRTLIPLIRVTVSFIQSWISLNLANFWYVIHVFTLFTLFID